MLDGILNTLEMRYGAPRLIELGKIKIGGLGETRKTNQGKAWRLPEKHDYFTITTLSRDSRTDGVRGDLQVDRGLMDELCEQYADNDGRLRQIPIRLLSDEISDVLQANFVWYGSQECGARSNGNEVTWFYDPATMKKNDPPVGEPWTEDHLDMKLKNGTRLFKLHANFSCVIACGNSRFGGVYKFRTTSVISFRQLHASLIHIHQLTGGILVGMPLMLVLRPLQVTPDGKATTIYVVHVELRGKDLAEVQRLAVDQARFKLEFRESLQKVQRQYRKLLVAPGYEESGDDRAEIIEEFQPENNGRDLPDDTNPLPLLDAGLPSGTEGYHDGSSPLGFVDHIGNFPDEMPDVDIFQGEIDNNVSGVMATHQSEVVRDIVQRMRNCRTEVGLSHIMNKARTGGYGELNDADQSELEAIYESRLPEVTG